MKLSQLMQQSHKPTHWDNMFFSEAVLWSRMSHDIETQCGCVIVKNRSTISTGYNGFMRDIDDNAFPNKRPDKYPFMLHAEENAIYNAVREGKSTMGAIIYVTAPPCTHCLQMLWQCGIKEIIFSDLSAPKSCFYGDTYDKVLKQICDRMVFKYVPKALLSSVPLRESAEKFDNLEKKYLQNDLD